MQHEIISRPSYSALKCTLGAGETIQAESGALLAMSSSAEVEGTMQGGAWQAIKRTVLTSESFFVTNIRAKEANTEVYLAPRATGDVQELSLNGDEFLIQGGCFLASEGAIQTDSKFTGWKGLVGGSGIFMIKASGTGTVFISSFGGVVAKQLKAGEKFTVDNGHIVAFDSSMKYDIGKVGSGIMNMVTSGEGLGMMFEGPGTILMQTRNLRTFAESLNPFLRTRERSQGKGILGDIFGG